MLEKIRQLEHNVEVLTQAVLHAAKEKFGVSSEKTPKAEWQLSILGEEYESYQYNTDGSLREVTDRKNIKTQYKYNPQGLVIEENAVLTNGSEQSYTKKNYVYDSVGNQLKSVITS